MTRRARRPAPIDGSQPPGAPDSSPASIAKGAYRWVMSCSCPAMGRTTRPRPWVSKSAASLAADLDIDEGRAAAAAAALSMLSTLKEALGDLDRVTRVVRLLGMVNCTPEFEDMPAVIDGASDLLYELFGPERGCHARAAVGMASLPRNQPVEISGEFEVRA